MPSNLSGRCDAGTDMSAEPDKNFTLGSGCPRCTNRCMASLSCSKSAQCMPNRAKRPEQRKLRRGRGGGVLGVEVVPSAVLCWVVPPHTCGLLEHLFVDSFHSHGKICWQNPLWRGF